MRDSTSIWCGAECWKRRKIDPIRRLPGTKSGYRPMVAQKNSHPGQTDTSRSSRTDEGTALDPARARLRVQVRAAGEGDVRAQRWLIEAVIGDVRGVARALIHE